MVIQIPAENETMVDNTLQNATSNKEWGMFMSQMGGGGFYRSP